MNDGLLLLLAGVSAFANRAAEAVKAFLHAHYPDLRPEVISEIALFVSLLAGIVGALALNVNLLALLPPGSYLAGLPPLVGVVLTGCIASLGSEGIHWLLDLLQAGRDRLEPSLAAKTTTTATVTTTGGGDASATVSSPEGAPSSAESYVAPGYSDTSNNYPRH